MDGPVYDADFLRGLRTRVEKAINQYVYTTPTNAVGQPMATDAVSALLDEMKECLAEPYWTLVELRDTIAQISLEQPPTRRCAVVADDGRYLLLWDPQENAYVLAELTNNLPFTFGVRGDAVGCFFSR